MLEALNYVIGTASLDITKTSPLEPAVRAANYVAAKLDRHISTSKAVVIMLLVNWE